jgi:hypothetical protein
MNSNIIFVVGGFIFSCLLAIYVGSNIPDTGYASIAVISFVFIAIVLLVSTRDKYWIFIPLTAGLTGGFSFLPLPFNVAELGSLTTFSIFTIYSVYKTTRSYAKVSWLDVIICINIIYLIITWVLHPVGFASTGGDNVGGRSYASILIAFLGYLVIRGCRAEGKLMYWLPAMIILPHLLLDLINLISLVYPSFGTALLPIYNGVSITELTNQTTGGDEERLFPLGKLGRTIIQSLVAYFPPLSFFSISKIPLLILFLFGFFMIGLSGFRSELISGISFSAISSALRKKGRDIFILGLIGCIGILILSSSYSLGVNLPFSIQRALSFIPLDWDPRAKKSGSDTAEWRFKMWSDALTTDSIIKNKLLGDGFGFTRNELNIMMGETFGGGPGFIGASKEESFIIKGSFHSGPVSSIRFVGFIGLALLTWMQIYLLVYATRLASRSINSPFLPMGIYIGMWCVYNPFEFYAIFGAYNNNFLDMLSYAGIARLLENSMNATLERA